MMMGRRLVELSACKGDRGPSKLQSRAPDLDD
jgi:hypothetical protein